MKKQRKQSAPEERVDMLRRHLLEKEPISKVRDEVELQPMVGGVVSRDRVSFTDRADLSHRTTRRAMDTSQR